MDEWSRTKRSRIIYHFVAILNVAVYIFTSYNDNIWFNCMFFSCFVFYTVVWFFFFFFLPSVRCVCDLKTLAVSIDKTVLMFGVVKSRRFCECIFNNWLLHFWDKKVEGFKKCSFANVKNHYMQFPKWKRKVIFFLLFFFFLFLMETSYGFRIKMVGGMDQFTCCGIFLHAALARDKIVSDNLENLWPDPKKDTKCCCGKLIMEILLFCIDLFPSVSIYFCATISENSNLFENACIFVFVFFYVM